MVRRIEEEGCRAVQVAVLETGLKIQVPPFIEIGEMIAVDTREGKYLSRKK